MGKVAEEQLCLIHLTQKWSQDYTGFYIVISYTKSMNLLEAFELRIRLEDLTT